MSGVRVTRGKDGVWFCRPYLGTNALTGKPMRPYRRFPGASGEAEARELAQEWVNTLAPAAGMRVSMRVGDVLSRYIAKIEADGAGANTVKTYRSMLRCYVEPYIGRADVGDVEPYVVDGLYFTLLTEGGRDGQGIAASKVVNLHWFLSGAWRWMASQGIAASNVLDSVTKPRPQPREAAAYDEADFAKLSVALAEELARDERGRSAVMRRNCAMAAYLALWTGMRCGEVCALARPDVRLAARTALVRATMVETPGGLVRQPKTKGKRSRSVSLYGETAERVRAHLDWQAEYLPKGLDVRRLGVCCDADGGFLRPSAVSAWFSGSACRGARRSTRCGTRTRRGCSCRASTRRRSWSGSATRRWPRRSSSTGTCCRGATRQPPRRSPRPHRWRGARRELAGVARQGAARGVGVGRRGVGGRARAGVPLLGRARLHAEHVGGDLRVHQVAAHVAQELQVSSH